MRGTVTRGSAAGTATSLCDEPRRRTGGTLPGMSEEPQYYFNTRTNQVETLKEKSQSKDLLGPYPTHVAAAAALETARARTEDWDEEDRRWREGE
jgi:hypothetical protein